MDAQDTLICDEDSTTTDGINTDTFVPKRPLYADNVVACNGLTITNVSDTLHASLNLQYCLEFQQMQAEFNQVRNEHMITNSTVTFQHAPRLDALQYQNDVLKQKVYQLEDELKSVHQRSAARLAQLESMVNALMSIQTQAALTAPVQLIIDKKDLEERHIHMLINQPSMTTATEQSQHAYEQAMKVIR